MTEKMWSNTGKLDFVRVYSREFELVVFYCMIIYNKFFLVTRKPKLEATSLSYDVTKQFRKTIILIAGQEFTKIKALNDVFKP